ncbi:MAG TPA: ankyrin repeat domain-containing protein [Bryobacteraceae bacterium]|jgi:ankyrin repeat protein|nr:ankyrin repeat domain-containing protein [Bryobacteraceae bacterium]
MKPQKHLWGGLVVCAGLTVPLFAAPGPDLRLVDAAKNHDNSALHSLLNQKVDVNAPDVTGMTPLIWAAHNDDIATVKMLLAAGANVKAANRYDITALSEAAQCGDGAMIEALVKAGADVNAAFGEGETPLMTASRTGSAAGVKALLAAGANVNATDKYRGETALMWASAENHADVAKLLVAAGADVNVRSTLYDFNFRKVAAGGTQAVYSRGGLTALLLAARQGATETAAVLLDGGADINLPEKDYGFTPLLEAIFNDHYDFAAYLVDRKASLKEGALYLAVEMRNLDYQGNRPRKAVTSKLDELGFINYLLSHGADPNGPMTVKIPPRAAQNAAVIPHGYTPFMRAARSADVETMKLLIAHGADPNKAADDRNTPLIVAGAGMGARFQGGEDKPEPQFVECMNLLVESGGDVNAVNDRGDTALHGAAARGADLIVQFLADHGAKFNIRNKQDRTPLNVAMGVGGVANTGGIAHPSTVALIQRLSAGNSTNN